MTLNELIEQLEQLRDSEPEAGEYDCAVWQEESGGLAPPGHMKLLDEIPAVEIGNTENYMINCRPISKVSDKIIIIG